MTIDGALSYLVLAKETTWGTTGTNKFHVPVEDYSVKFNAENRQSALFSGIHQRKYSRNFRGMPAGGITLPLFSYWVNTDGTAGEDESIAQVMLEWAFNSLDATFTDSMTAEWAEGPDTSNLRHAGLRVNSITLSGDDSTGSIMCSLDLMGKSEETFATAVALPDDREKFAEFLFADQTLTVDATEVNPSNWSLTANFGQSPKYLGSANPTLLNRTQCQIDFSFTVLKTDDTYPAYHRAVTTDQDLDIQIALVGSHNGTGSSGTNTTLTIDMPQCRMINPDDSRVQDLVPETIQTHVLKPDTSEDSIQFTWGVA